MYLCANLEFSSIILTNFRQGVFYPSPHTSKQTPKKPTQISVKIYTTTTQFITKECDITRIFICKNHIIIREYSIIKIFNQITCNKLNRNKFLWLKEKQEQHFHIFLGSYICQGNVL